MTSLALEVGNTGIAVARIADNDVPGLVLRMPIPPLDGWIACRNLLLDIAGEDEIATIGIACRDLDSSRPAAGPASAERWQKDSDLKSAVQRTFPAATIFSASYHLCVSLAEYHTGGLPPEKLALTGAGILARLASLRRLADGLERVASDSPAGIADCSRTPPRACVHRNIRRRHPGPRPL
ncbi:hypothetical protein [Nocardia sp. NPDC003345]